MANVKTPTQKKTKMLTPTEYGVSQDPTVSKQAVLYRIKHKVPLPGVMTITRVGTRWVLEVPTDSPPGDSENTWRARPDRPKDPIPIPATTSTPPSLPTPSNDEPPQSSPSGKGLTKQQLEIRKKRLGY